MQFASTVEQQGRHARAEEDTHQATELKSDILAGCEELGRGG